MKTSPLWHSRARRVWSRSTRPLALLLALITVMSAALASAPAASAATAGATGAGISIYPAGYGEVWLGPHIGPGGINDVLYCTQARVYTSAGETNWSSGVVADDPALAFVISKYRLSGDNLTQAAIAYLVHMRHEEPGSMAGGDVSATKRLLSDATPAEVKTLAANLLNEGASQGGPYRANFGTVDTTTKRTGSIKNVGVTGGSGEYVAGVEFELHLNGPAVFDATGTNVLTGVTQDHGLTVTWTATGNGAVTGYMVAKALYRQTLTYITASGQRQNGITYDLRNPVYDPVETTSTSSTFEVVKDFQPLVSSQVQVTTLSKGETLTDAVTVGVAAGDEWVKLDGKNIDVKVRGTLYGPLSKAAATSTTVPVGAPVASNAMLTFAGAGSKNQAWTATQSGVYAWVWEVRKADQGGNAQYIRANASDAYFASSETFKVRMSPQLSTQVADRYSDGASNLANDTVTVSLPEGDVWLADDAGNNLPLRARVTAYGPYNTPTAAQAATPGSAPAVGTQFVTFTSPGTKNVPVIAQNGKGFYTYVAEILPADQSAAMQAVLEGPVRDWFMLGPETTSARFPVTHSSETREYNVAVGGRAFDTITISGMPADHGSFTGLGDWQADVATATVTVYGPTSTPITTATVPEGTPVLKTVTIPAKNGTYNIGYTAADMVSPNLPGHYVFVYSFAGDARVQPYTSRADDVREKFYVPENGAPWADVMSTATQNATAGEGSMSDTVLVTGNGVPAEGSLVWTACTWVDPSTPGCAQPVQTHTVALTGSGFYNHPEIPVPGIEDMPVGALVMYYGWSVTLLDANGVVIDREPFGTPSQTTTIRAEVPDWTSTAPTSAKLDDKVSDTVAFAGPTRSDWSVQWYRCVLEGDECPDGAAVAVGDPVRVDPASDTLTSPEWTVEVSADTKPGTQVRVGWQPVLLDGLGAELAREPWGTDGQVTTIDYPLPSMTSTATPKALIGEISQDTVSIVGPLLAGSRVVWAACYFIEAEDGPRECRQDAIALGEMPANDDGTVGLEVGPLAVGETLTVQSPELKVTEGGLVPDLGLRLTWTPRIVGPDSEVLVQEAVGLPEQTTTVEFPPIKATTKAYSTNSRGPFYGDEIGDRVEVENATFILPGDSVTVRLYAWEKGTPPLCTGEPLATVKLDLTPSLSTYDTGPVYTTPEDRTNLVYGFQETTVSRGLTVVSKCGLAAETLPMTVDPWSQWSDSASGQQSQASGELAITGVQRLGWLFGAALVMALVGGQLVHMREKRRPAQHLASS